MMLIHALFILQFWFFSVCRSSEVHTNCPLLDLNNITKDIQSSIVVTLLNDSQNLLEDAKNYAKKLTSCNASAENPQCASFLLKNITDEVESSIVLTLVSNVKALLDNVVKYTRIKTRCSDVEIVHERPFDCADVKEENALARSGVYKIWPRNGTFSDAVEVYCDMEDDGGAWTLLQRRGDFGREKEYFYKDWLSYKNGFGDPAKDFWIGNDNIFGLTNKRSNVVKFTLTDWDGNQRYATYDEFWIDDEFHNYKLHVSGYNGTAGDSFAYHDGNPFSTKDKCNDASSAKNCAKQHKGAWWYKSCFNTNLNALYSKGSQCSNADCVAWRGFKGDNYSLKDTVIKIRPKDFQKNLHDVTPL